MLYLPTTDREVVYLNSTLAKGQLYNLDLNQYIGFQFNPTELEWTRDINWSEHNWVGSYNGGDLQFMNLGPRVISLDLIYLADPRAPEVQYNTDYKIMNEGVVDFQAIKDTIDKWLEPLDGLNRPSRISIVVGPNVFNGVITSTSFKITTFFEDLTPREAMLSLEFREWIPIS